MADGWDSGQDSGERGVSEAIGFILIFSLVVTGIALVTLYGYPVLMKQQMGTDVRIMEKTMIVLQNDVKSLAYKNVPFKETSLKVSGGVLSARNASTTPQGFSVYVNGVLQPVTAPPFQPGELRFDADLGDTVLSLENGAVMTRSKIHGGSAMLADPRWFFDDQSGTFVITLIQFATDFPLSQAGVGTIQMQVTGVNYTEMNCAGQIASVQYTPDPDSDSSVAWNSYFATTLGLAKDPGGNGYQLPPATTKIVIKTYVIKILSI